MKVVTYKSCILIALAQLAGTTAVEAHARLDSATPAAGSSVSAPPSQVTMHFTERLEPKFSGAQVHDANGARVDTGSSVSGSTISVRVKQIGPGNYIVSWHALSTDTHRTEGSFKFHVK